MNKVDFILKLKEIDALKFGKFTLKSGIESPFYINLREIVSYPDIMNGLADLLIKEVINNTSFDVMTGVPYTALPIASIVSAKINKPMIYKRKEDKVYGLKKSIIGKYNKNDTCFVLEDLITTGESILENTEALEKDGLRVKDVAVIIDRSSDKGQALKDKGYRLHTLLTLDEITSVLKEHRLLSEEKAQEIIRFVEEPKTKKSIDEPVNIKNPMTKMLLDKIKAKQSNLILSLDVEDSDTFFSILDKVANDIVMLKTHIDIIKDFTPDFIKKLTDYSKKYDFMLFEDRKFADIGNTVRMQYKSGAYNIVSWADFVTVHMIAGESILNGLFDNVSEQGFGNKSSFLLARMSASGNLITESYTRKVIEIGKNNEHCVSGFIGHGQNEDDLKRFKNKIPPNFLLLMPGVKLESKSDTLGQSYVTPDKAVRGGADCIIVGRGIINSTDPKDTAKRYRETAFNEYLKK